MYTVSLKRYNEDNLKHEKKLVNMKKTKIFLVIILIISCFVSISQVAFAESAYKYESESWQIYKLGLFAGASSDRFNPDLGVKLNRQIGITLLLNFFGKTPEVKQLSSTDINGILSSYTDQSLILPWARPYMAFAVKTGMIVGTSSTTIGPSSKLDGVSFAAMILRYLGYPVERKDFINSIQTLCDKRGLDTSDVNYFNKLELTKDDAVGMVYNSLFAVCSNEESLIENLISSGVVPVETALSLGIVQYNNPASVKPVSREVLVKKPAGYQQVYDLISEALLSGKTSIVLPKNEYTDNFDKIVDMVNACLRETPEIQYYSGMIYKSNGELTLKYNKNTATIKAHREKLDSKVGTILSQIIKPNMTDYQKELAVHNYLVENCEYNMEGVNNDQINSESFTAYGALCMGVAVCEGYSKAASILLNRSGVETKIVLGESKGVGHAWNMVKIDGDFYHIDITWDDPYQIGKKSGIMYNYFNLTDSDISLDHQWDKNEYEACTATKYNYYKYNNLAVKNQDEYINRVIEEVQRGNKTIELKILESDPKKFNMSAAVEILVNKLFLGCAYSYNEEIRIARISFY